ncbi:MAG: transglutaminase-like cysteine peptidase [Hyphomicrobiales bacterium]
MTTKVRRFNYRAAAFVFPLFIFLLAGFVFTPSQGHAASDEVIASELNLDAFGNLAVRSNPVSAKSAYGKIRAAWAAENSRFRACFENKNECDAPHEAWINQIKLLKGMSVEEQLAGVNALANQAVVYRSDNAVHGVGDHWALPSQSLAVGGDCEDYAIVKFFSLQALGVNADAMRIVVLKDILRKQAHAVLTVKHKGKTYVLDNLSRRVLRARDVPHYKPVYSVSNAQRWIHLSVKKRSKSSLIAQK